MNTFLPYSSFAKSAQCLDYRRLGKQRVEAKQILAALSGQSKGWVNHPATLMWTGYEANLRAYLKECITEWVKRGYKNTMEIPDSKSCDYSKPHWLTTKFIKAHRSNLLRKDAKYYSKFKWNVPDSLPYVWPYRKG